jgi:hypothetical protein
MPDLVTAFRLYGSFVWPPMPARWYERKGRQPDDADARDGIVEIHLVPAGSGRHVACLRWIPTSFLIEARGGAVSVPLPVNATIDSFPRLSDFEADALAELFEQRGDEPQQFRIDTDRFQPRLQFRGGRVLDQFRLDRSGVVSEVGEDPRPDRRVPLVRFFRFKGENHWSQLIVGQSGADAFRFDLALPLPVPMQDEQSREQPGFFSFSTVHSCVLAELEQQAPFPIHTFVAGLVGHPDYNEQVVLRRGRIPEPYIGHFGFCKDGEPQGFLTVPDRRSAQNFWPNDVRRTPTSLFQLVDFPIRNPDRHLLLGVRDEESLSLRFDPIEDVSENSRAIEQDVYGEERYGVVLSLRIGLGNNDDSLPDADFGSVWRRGGRLRLKHSLGPNGPHWIDTGDSFVYVDLELTFKLSTRDVLYAEPEGPLGACRGEVRIGFDDAVDAVAAPSPGASRAMSVAQLLALATAAMRQARFHLRSLASDEPQSILPELAVQRAGRKQFALHSRLAFSLLRTGHFARVRTRDGAPGEHLVRKLSLGAPRQYPRGEARKRVELAARLPSFDLESSPDPTFSLRLAHDERAATGEASSRPALFRIDEPDGSAARVISRLGGFRFARSGSRLAKGGAPSPLEPTDHLDVAVRAPFGRAESFGEGLQALDLSLRLQLAADLVEPVATDIGRGDRQERADPLLIRESEDDGQPVGEQPAYVLDVSEDVSGETDWRLTASLFDRAVGGTATTSFVLLSQEPFGVARFRTRPLSARGDATSSAAAYYDSDTRRWQIRQVASQYRYVLQAQAVGEGMDKPRRLEIEDPAPDTNEEPLRPADPDKPRARRVVGFRLTPPAELWVRPSDVERGFVPPEWASYDIFRQRSELGLGAALDALRAEFLYGLSVGINPRDETGPARRARVAEVEALTGRPVAVPSASRGDDLLVQRWRALRRTMARRPERLEVWADDPDQPLLFAPARFTAGARFALRHTALHRHPVTDAPSPADAFEAPDAGIPDLSPRTHRSGLSGGALWPIESNNVFEALRAAPGAAGGEIQHIALSPLGGDADQKARFLGNLVSIVSRTRGGFVEHQQVEVVGRIGVFWHRAKHVVVYERTVNPSAQFTPEDGLGSRTRRPVLRKVSEYIEIIELERFYPDNEAGSQRSVGFLRALRFNSRIIPVDSAWGEDVDTFGWRVPLWNRHAARIRPQVYPRPDIAFVTAAEGGQGALSAQECSNPDNLFFFTDVQAGNDATDTWAPRPGIDFATLPAPVRERERTSFLTSEQQDGAGARPNPIRIPRGHARFTWRLAPAAQRTVVNAARAEKPIYAALDTLTFMRSDTGAPNPEGDPLHKVVDETLAPPDIDVSGILEGRHWRKGGGPDHVKQPDLRNAAAALERLTNLLAASTAPDVALVDVEVAGIAAGLTGLAASPTVTAIINKATEFGARIGEAETALNGVLKPTRDLCGKVKTDFLTALQRKELLLVEAVRSYEAHALEVFDREVPDKEDIAEQAANELTRLIKPLFEAGAREIGSLRSGIERGRSALQDLRADGQREVATAVARVGSVRRAFDAQKPWSKRRLNTLDEQLRQPVEKLFLNFGSLASETWQRLATEVDAASQTASNAAQAVLNELAQVVGSAEGGAEALSTGIGDRLKRLSSTLDRFATPEGSIGRLAAMLGQAAARPDLPTPVRESAERLSGLAEQARTLVLSAGEAARGAITRAERTSEETRALLLGAKELVSETSRSSQALAIDVQETIETWDETIDPALRDGLASAAAALGAVLDQLESSVLSLVQESGAWTDGILDDLEQHLVAQGQAWLLRIDQAAGALDDAAARAVALLQDAEQLVRPEFLVGTVVGPLVIKPAVDAALRPLPAAPLADVLEYQTEARRLIRTTSSEVQALLKSLRLEAIEALEPVRDVCTTLEKLDPKGFIEHQIAGFGQRVADFVDSEGQLGKRARQIKDLLGDFEQNRERIEGLRAEIESDVRAFGNDLVRSREAMASYGERVLEQAANLTRGGLASTPNNLLRLYAAAASAPELPNLEFARDRLNYYYNGLNNIIDTSPAEAVFARLGDELKALGLSLPFRQIGDRLVFDDLSHFDISRVFRNFGGLDLNRLFPGYKLPAGASDAIRVTHEFDNKQLRAWVQIDIDVPLPGRATLFTFGSFRLDLVATTFRGLVRLDASKDSERVEQTGSAQISTDIKAVVAGQTMVALRRVVLHHSKDTGLKVDFDPRNIELNEVFRFIQNTLGTLFADDLGALRIIKSKGVPVGVAHELTLPPISLMYGTSGVSNIQIANSFELVAFPDFKIANRFSLAKPELPFIFSVFIIGGTGWLTVDTEYRPFTDELMVVVEAAAGGSASIGFAFSGVTGTVMITVSVALSYRKLIGSSEGGLTASLVVLIAGNVDVLGIVRVYIGVLLRLSYRENGDIDAVGSLTVSVRISRFFKITVSRDVRYEMKGGRERRSSSSGVNGEITDPALKRRIDEAKTKAERLLKAA